MNEFELIARLRPRLPGNASVVVGAGDDCAVLSSPGPGRQLLLKTDCVVEGVHFLPDTDPAKIGRKALARALSDVAANAGTPTAAVVTLGLPDGFDPGRIEALYDGMAALARRHDVAIVGGETTRSPGSFFVSVSLLGWVGEGKAVLRSGAKIGDALFVTGELGGSILGHHLDFEPRLAEARWLAEHIDIHAMMDLSDGLAGDLPHLLAESGVPGAEIHREALPIRRAALLRAREGDTATPAVAAALGDGEDFELLMCVAPRDAVPLLDGFKARFPETRITCIGRLTATPGVFLREPRGLTPVTRGGYRHFAG